MNAHELNLKLAELMQQHGMKIYDYMLQDDDVSLRSQQLVSTLNDALSSGDVIYINRRGLFANNEEKRHPIIRSFLSRGELTELGQHVYNNMPSVA